MQEIHLDVGFPPTVNSYYVHTKRGVFISKKGREFRLRVMHAANEQMVYGMKNDLRLSVDVILYPPDKRQRDLDNYMKALLDAVTHAKIWEDDSQIDYLGIHRGKVVKGGMCRIRICEHHGFILPEVEDTAALWNLLD